MIKIRFIHCNHATNEMYGLPTLTIKEFKDLDEFLIWYFKEDGDKWFIDSVLEGHDIITGEIKQKGINNK